MDYFDLPFGKHRGRALYQITEQDPGYVWYLASLSQVRNNREFWSALKIELQRMLDAERTQATPVPADPVDVPANFDLA